MHRLPDNIKLKIKVCESGCWEWTAAIDRYGYGKVSYNGVKVKAHRIVFLLIRGNIKGKHLDHLCRNRKCVNPDHLDPVTNLQNTRRGIKSRSKNGRSN